MEVELNDDLDKACKPALGLFCSENEVALGPGQGLAVKKIVFALTSGILTFLMKYTKKICS